MATDIKKSQSAVLPVNQKSLQFSSDSELFVAEVVVSHVDRQPDPQMRCGPAARQPAVRAWNRVHLRTSADRNELRPLSSSSSW